jgi:hypothetical protein
MNVSIDNMNLPRIIALCGRKRCGKDTVANFLCTEYNYINKKISQDLKNVIKTLFGFTNDQIESDAKDIIDEKWGITPRKTMQFFGTEIMQEKIQELLPGIGRRFWIESFIKNNISNDINNNFIVISDLRFLHEYEELKKYNVFVIRIERNYLYTNINNNEHISETEFLKIPANICISNNESIDELNNKVRTCLIKFNNT